MKRYLKAKPVGWAVGVAVAVSFVLFSSFFTNLRGPLDSCLAYVSFLGRGTLGSHGGGVHCHPWHYYLGILAYTKLAPGPWWSEAGILALAAVGAAAALRPARAARSGQRRGPDDAAENGKAVFGLPAGTSVGLARFLVFYTLLMTLAYSLIPYKTPWCILSFLHGMILLAGLGAVVIVAGVRDLVTRPDGEADALWRRALRLGAVPAVACLVAAIPLHLAWQARRATTTFQADRRNPYVYAHTAPDLVRLARRVEEIAEVSPEGRNMLVEVVAPDVWPLPWYFRGFSRVGYWTEMPDTSSGQGGAFDFGAPVLVLSPEHARRIAPDLKREYQVAYYGLRPTVHLLLHIRRDLWEAFMEGRATGG